MLSLTLFASACERNEDFTPLDLLNYNCELTDAPAGCITVSSLDSTMINDRLQGSWRVLLSGGGWSPTVVTAPEETFKFTLGPGNTFTFELPDGTTGATTYELIYTRRCLGGDEILIYPAEFLGIAHIPVFYELCENGQFARHDDQACDGSAGAYCRL